MSFIKFIVHLTAKLNFCSYFLYFLTDLADIDLHIMSVKVAVCFR